MLCTFSFGCFQIYQNKSAKNIAIYFIGTIVSIKCMPKISAVGLFCLDKFENYQTRTCTTFFRTPNLTEPYFSYIYNLNASFHSVSSTVCPLLRSVKSYSSGVKFLRSYYTMCIGSSSFWRVLEWRAATNHIVATSLAAEAAAAAVRTLLTRTWGPGSRQRHQSIVLLLLYKLKRVRALTASFTASESHSSP